MASIPLVALSVKPPEQYDAVQQYSRLAQLRGLQQQQQQAAAEAPYRQQILEQQAQSGALGLEQARRQQASQDAIMSAWSEADGNLGKTYQIAAKSGKVLPGDLTKLQQANLAMQQHALGLFKAKGEAAVQEADLMSGAADAVKNAPEEARPQVYQQQLASLQQAGIDVSQLPQQYPGDQALKAITLGVKSHKAALDELQKQSQIQESQASAQLKQMQASQGGTTDTDKFIHNYLTSKGLEDTPTNRLLAQKEYIKETKIVPQQVRVDAYGNIREYPVFDTKSKTTVYMTPAEVNQAKLTEPGRYTVPTYSPEAIGQKVSTQYFTTGKGSQQLTAFNTAMQHLDLLSNLANALGNRNLQVFNKAAQTWATQTGNPAPASFDAAKNAMAGEVAAALKASGATDQEIEKVDSTFSRVQSPMQLQGAIKTYRSLLRSKAGVLQQQYQQGMQGRPNFEGEGVTPGAVSSGTSDPFAQFGGKAH